MTSEKTKAARPGEVESGFQYSIEESTSNNAAAQRNRILYCLRAFSIATTLELDICKVMVRRATECGKLHSVGQFTLGVRYE